MEPEAEPEGARVVPATDHRLGYWLRATGTYSYWCHRAGARWRWGWGWGSYLELEVELEPIPLELGIWSPDQLS